MGSLAGRSTYKKSTRGLLVEMDAEPNAEHWVEPESEMHSWAMARGAVARRDKRAVLVLIRGRRSRWEVALGSLLEDIARSR